MISRASIPAKWRLVRAAAIGVIVGAVCLLVTPQPAVADNCGSFSDCFFTADGAQWALLGTFISLLLDFTPVVGTGKGIIEAITGRDLITGEELEDWERALGILGPLGKGVKILAVAGAAGTIIVWARRTDRAIDTVESGADAARTGERAGDVVEAGTDLARASDRADDLAGTAADVARRADDAPWDPARTAADNLARRHPNWTPPDDYHHYTPRQVNGRFLGEYGNSAFEVSEELAARTGFETGDLIEHVNGVPDLVRWAQPGPNGIPPPQFRMPDEALFSNTKQGLWLQEQNLTPHHSVIQSLGWECRKRRLVEHHCMRGAVSL